MSPTALVLAVAVRLEPPLDPDPDRARRLLEQELGAPRYQPTAIERLQQWLDDLLSTGPDPSNPLLVLVRPVLLVLLLAVAVAVIWVVVRLRRDPRSGGAAGTVFDDVRRTAAEHRSLARAALADGDWDRAVVEGVRAISAGLAERHLVQDSLAATAHEVAAAAGPRFPTQSDRLATAARVFDETRYGGRTASRTQAQSVIDLERELSAARPVTAQAAGPVAAVPR